MLHIDVPDDAECGMFQRKVEFAISDSNTQGKPKDVFKYSTRDGLKTHGLTHKSKLEEKSKVSGEILLPSIYNLRQFYLLPLAMRL